MNDRSRVSAGVKEGGQFATEVKSEPDVALGATRSAVDTAVIASLASRARAKMSIEIGRWMRRQDKGRRYDEPARPEPEWPEVLVRMKERTDNFEHLPASEQATVLQALELREYTHLLQPGQSLGNDRVALGEDLDVHPGDLAMALHAQKQITDAKIPGDITLTKVDGGKAIFKVEDGGITSEVAIQAHMVDYQAVPDQEYGEQADWLALANFNSYPGGVSLDHYRTHHETAVMMNVVAESPISYSRVVRSFNLEDRSVELVEEGNAYILSVGGDVPELRTEPGRGQEYGTKLHESMRYGFMNHIAHCTGDGNADMFVRDVQEVFRETRRRLVR